MYYSLPYKTKQFFWLLIKLAIIVGCGYFIYQKLVKNNLLSFSCFIQNLIKNNVFSAKNITFLLFFTFFNWFLEVFKWKELASFSKKTDFKNATIQSLASLTTSLITPNRIGEYGAKALYFKKKYRKQIVGLNLVGNFYQMLATVFFGLFGFLFFISKHNVTIDYHKILKGLLLGVFLISTFFFGAKRFNYRGYGTEKARIFINKITKSLNLKIGVLSFLRYIVFSHQFYFLLLIFNIEISYINALSAIASVYFVASVIPMLSLFDVILKSSVAVWCFSYVTSDVISVLSITTLMWILNFVLPAVIGSYFVITFKPTLP